MEVDKAWDIHYGGDVFEVQGRTMREEAGDEQTH